MSSSVAASASAKQGSIMNFFKKGSGDKTNPSVSAKTETKDATASPKDKKEKAKAVELEVPMVFPTSNAADKEEEDSIVAKPVFTAVTGATKAKSERRSKRAEDKIIAAAAAPMSVPVHAADASMTVKFAAGTEAIIEEPSDSTVGSSNTKSRKRLRRVVKDDDDESDDDVLSATNPTIKATAALVAENTKKYKTIRVFAKEEGRNMGAKAAAATTRRIIEEIRELTPGYPSLPYQTLTNVLEAVEAVTGRLEITDIVRELFAKTIECCPTDLPVLLYLLCGKIGPAYEAVELGIGDKNIVDALVKGLGCSSASLNQKGEGADGDLGTAAQRAKGSQRTLNFGAKPNPLTSQQVLQGFRDVAACAGGKSMTQKIDIIRKLLMRCAKEGAEVKFLVRGLQTKLRCRLAEPTVLTALSQAFVQTPPVLNAVVEEEMSSLAEATALAHGVAVLCNPKAGRAEKWEAAEAVVKQAYSECPNYDRLVAALLSAPLPHVLQTCRLAPGVPVKPMLAKAQDSFQDVLRRMQGLHFTMEYKYDGERAQVHLLPDGSFKIFSRNSEDTTTKYPDLLAVLPQALRAGTTSFVIDAEAVAIDPDSGKLLPFQILSTRKRKNEKVEDVKVQVVLYAFDILFLNDRPVLQEPLLRRRALLRDAFVPVPGKFDFAISLDHHENGDTSAIEAFLDEAVAGNCEGLMIKTLEQNATYEPTKRSLNWLKLKKDYLSGGASGGGRGPADSLDLVVLGGNHGQGKRVGWYGAFLLACYDSETEEYQSVCKIGTGFSEEFLAAMKPQLDVLILPGGKPGYYNTSLDCDVWFEPKIVWEVRAADLSVSPAHKGALDKVEKGKGIALRFPRFIRNRADKAPEDATSAEQIAEAYRSQALVEATLTNGGGKGKGAQDEDDDWCI
ncbi:atp-dependent dna ligase [Nannochloropsis oceanica]